MSRTLDFFDAVEFAFVSDSTNESGPVFNIDSEGEYKNLREYIDKTSDCNFSFDSIDTTDFIDIGFESDFKYGSIDIDSIQIDSIDVETNAKLETTERTNNVEETNSIKTIATTNKRHYDSEINGQNFDTNTNRTGNESKQRRFNDGRDRSHIESDSIGTSSIGNINRTQINSINSNESNRIQYGQSTISDVSSDRNGNRVISTRTELIQKIQKNLTRERLIHDVVDIRTDQRYNYVISQLQLIKKTNCGFFFSVLHEKCNFRHIHLIHDCSFINSCRCTILKNIPINRRLKRNTRLICDLDNDYVENLVNYFTTDEYKILQIFFGGTRWTLLDQDHGKCFIFFKY